MLNHRDFAKTTAGVAAALLTGEIPGSHSIDELTFEIYLSPYTFEMCTKIEVIQGAAHLLKSESERLGHLPGMVNDAPFYIRLFPAGTLMFLGASYSVVSDDWRTWKRRLRFQRLIDPQLFCQPKRADFSPLEPSEPIELWNV